jgi:hypothetical protein
MVASVLVSLLHSLGSSLDHARRCTSKSWRSVISSPSSTERAVRVSD